MAAAPDLKLAQKYKATLLNDGNRSYPELKDTPGQPVTGRDPCSNVAMLDLSAKQAQPLANSRFSEPLRLHKRVTDGLITPLSAEKRLRGGPSTFPSGGEVRQHTVETNASMMN
ncbi:uncharacterized protein NECHADRAFT_81333 [Fusarium vanettenii 77-13-4]|uniref:Uncharacterized protein n=1 Tax=Fusarium vanettenii (strain ATCC MYA-4622 / CBS 123669 / FGSC 9596 / NRRL 45880 / 77-13-4) TaxID=660122 RepID=C7ZKT2_FUSV7|nr:uncharacterized protein NECHADRAFT_81333 [Fusarium vanettenii 77-13-4]EEU35353.1 predicted protein [Fusarium vanettenii 77-13-4]